jgi:putative hydrolase of the HAD superfamily
MKRSKEVTTLFLDIGGVLLTDGWDHQSQGPEVKALDLNVDETEHWHHLNFNSHKMGKLTRKEYVIQMFLTKSN